LTEVGVTGVVVVGVVVDVVVEDGGGTLGSDGELLGMLGNGEGPVASGNFGALSFGTAGSVGVVGTGVGAGAGAGVGVGTVSGVPPGGTA
jgi:hypothetical protein